jgi:nitronate monooxygenase
MALWAGLGHRMARELPAGQLVEVLIAEITAAETALSAAEETPEEGAAR